MQLLGVVFREAAMLEGVVSRNTLPLNPFPHNDSF